MAVFGVILVHIFPAFSRIWTEHGKTLRIPPYSVQMRENTGKMRTRITPNTDTFYVVRIAPNTDFFYVANTVIIINLELSLNFELLSPMRSPWYPSPYTTWQIFQTKSENPSLFRLVFLFWYLTERRICPNVFCKKLVLKTFPKPSGKNAFRSLFSQSSGPKNKTPAKMLSYKPCEILQEQKVEEKVVTGKTPFFVTGPFCIPHSLS